MCGKDGHVTVHSAVMSSELMGTAPTDLPYILRVESRQRCWPVQNLYLLAPSFPVKQKWVTSLEFVLDEIKKKNNNGEDQVCKVQWNKRVNFTKEVKCCVEPNGPSCRKLSRFLKHEARSISIPPGWDASSSQGYPQH